MALAVLEQEHERDHAQPFRAREGDLELQKLLLLMFIDTHNTGFYVNSYTTKWFWDGGVHEAHARGH